MEKTFVRITADDYIFHFLALPGTKLFHFNVTCTFGAHTERLFEKKKNIYGLSHLVEHLSFKSTKDFSTVDMNHLLKEKGAHNAYTCHNDVTYWFETSSDNMDLAIQLVSNYAFNDLTGISKDEFNLERNIVVNEVQRYEGEDQTMFYWKMVPTICGYHNEDTIVGIPSTIKKFKLKDAIALKDMMLNNGTHFVNVMYDPTCTTPEEIIEKSLTQFKRFHNPSTNEDITHDYLMSLKFPKVGEYIVDIDSKQSWTSLVFNTPRQIWGGSIGNNYIASLAKGTSLMDILREQHGLTYGVSLFHDFISYAPHTVFWCDVTQGKEYEMMDRFVESVNLTADGFNEEKYQELMNTTHLRRTLRYVNQRNYNVFFDELMWTPELYTQHITQLLAQNIDDAVAELDNQYASYQELSTYLNQMKTLVNTETWSKTTNY